jgi:hypothetical protein
VVIARQSRLRGNPKNAPRSIFRDTLPIDPKPEQMRQLTPSQYQRVCQLHTLLAEANPISLGEWIAGFEADSEVERELRVHEAVAATYIRATRTTILSSQEKQKLFEDLVVLSYDPEKPIVRPTRLPRGLPPWEEIVGWYREEWKKRG